MSILETQSDLVFKALAAPIRRAILDALKDQPKTTSALCDEFRSLDRCTVMQHLSVLEGAGLVIARRKGRERWNYLDAIPIKRIHDRWIGPLAARSVTMLDQLKTDVELRRRTKTPDSS